MYFYFDKIWKWSIYFRKKQQIIKIGSSDANSGTEDSDSDSESDSDSDSSSEESSKSEVENGTSNDSHIITNKHSENSNKNIEKTPPKSNLDLLLELDDLNMSTPVMTPSLGGFLTPITPNVASPSPGEFDFQFAIYCYFSQLIIFNNILLLLLQVWA